MKLKGKKAEPDLCSRGRKLLHLARRNIGRAWRTIEAAKLQLAKKAR